MTGAAKYCQSPHEKTAKSKTKPRNPKNPKKRSNGFRLDGSTMHIFICQKGDGPIPSQASHRGKPRSANPRSARPSRPLHAQSIPFSPRAEIVALNRVNTRQAPWRVSASPA